VAKQGYVKVTFNGEEKLLRFDFNAMADLEDHFDKGISTIFDSNRIGFSTIRALYWAGLKWKISGLTIEKAGAMLSDKMESEGISFNELMTPITKAITAAGWIKPKEETTEQGETDPKN
jgi:hypothetical protein